MTTATNTQTIERCKIFVEPTPIADDFEQIEGAGLVERSRHKWTTDGTPGPIQVKRINKAISETLSAAETRASSAGGGYIVLGIRSASYYNPEPLRVLVEIGERYGWTVTKANAAKIVKDFDAAADRINERTPGSFRDETDDELQNRVETARRVAVAEAERQAEAERSRSIELQIMNKRPPRAAALIVAELRVDESDAMSDYFHARTVRTVAIGWRSGTREDFRQLRAAAVNFPETAHLGPNCGRFVVVTEREEMRDGSRARFIGKDGDPRAFYFDRKIFESRDAAERAADGIESAEIEETGEKIEHRDNYSMGAGNWVGISRYSGWCVRSVDLKRDGSGLGWSLPGLEDGLPEPSSESSAAELEPGELPAGVAMVEQYHNRRGCKIWTVTQDERTDRATFDRNKAAAKAAGGWYYKAYAGNVGGFHFETQDAAQDFARTVEN